MNYGFTSTVTKLFRVGDDMIVGLDGTMGEGMALIEWLKAGRDYAKYPKPADTDSVTYLLIIHRGGRIERVEANGYGFTVEDEKYASGSGRDLAFAAMMLGKTAPEAVAFASRFNSGCGNGVDELRVENPPA